MVRLKLRSLKELTGSVIESQFHYGSIKTWKFGKRVLNQIQSQFHYGSIKTYCRRKTYREF